MLLRRSKAMCARKKIINWLRICRRLRSLNQRAPYYHKMRTKWVVLMRWLKYLEREAMLPTPGLMDEIRRRSELAPKYSALLTKRGILPVVYHNSIKLRKATSDVAAVFARWQNYTQTKLIFTKLKKLVFHRYYMRLVQKCFYAIKLSMRPEDTRKEREAEGHLPLERMDCDISQICKRFISKYRRSLAYIVRRYNTYFDAYVKTHGKKSNTFKQFVINYHHEVDRRLATEQRTLVDAYDRRGCQQFVDLQTPSNHRHPIIPDIMQKVEGSRFFDPSPQARYFTVHGMKAPKPASLGLFSQKGKNTEREGNRELEIDPDAKEMPEVTPGSITGLPAGFKLNKIRVTFGDHIGMAGWQVNWCADGIRDIDGPRRGHWFGGASAIQELAVPRGDFVIGVEYYHDGSALMGLRLKLFNGGWTKWVGGKTSLSTQSVFLGVELTDRQPFEDEHVPAGPDEVAQPAFPREYVVGLAGVQTATRVTNLTLVVRKVREQFLLSYFWVKDALDKILHEMYETVKEKWLEHQNNISDDRSGAPSENGGASNNHFLPSIKNNNNRRTSVASSIPNTARSESNKSDQVGPTSSRLNPNISTRMAGQTLETLDELNSLDDFNSDAGGSEVSNEDDKSESPLEEEMRHISWMSKYGFGTGSEERRASESQFFDLMRMRALEVTVAKGRGLELARRLWTDKELRVHPELKKLTTITMVRGITMWFFNAISKRLIRLVVTENQGNMLLLEARSLRKKSELLYARAAGMKMMARNMENTPQSWAGKSLLSPAERALRKVYKDRIRTYYVEAKAQEEDAAAVASDALNTEKAGRNLLPRLQLSKYTINVFLRKLAAARHKETLLQYISVDTVKAALTGIAEKSSGLPTTDMETIMNCLKAKTDDGMDEHALEMLVEREVQKERQRKAKSGTSLPLITIRTMGRAASPNGLGQQVYLDDQDDEALPTYMKAPMRRKRVLAVDPVHQIVRGRGSTVGIHSRSLNQPLALSKTMSAGALQPAHSVARTESAKNAAGTSSKKANSPPRQSMPILRRGSSVAGGSSLSTLSLFDDEDI
jgi:hypothetical protein